MGTAENAQAGAVDGDLLALHQQAEGVMVAVQHGIDEAAVVHGPIVPCSCAHPTSVVPAGPAVVAAAGAGVAAVVIVAAAGAGVVTVILGIAGTGVVLLLAATAGAGPILVLALGFRTLGSLGAL